MGAHRQVIVGKNRGRMLAKIGGSVQLGFRQFSWPAAVVLQMQLLELAYSGGKFFFLICTTTRLLYQAIHVEAYHDKLSC